MQRHIKTSIVLCLALSISACTKREEHHYVDREIVSWFDFPQASYWVLKDSASGAVDRLALQGGVSNMQSLTTHSFSETYNLYLKEYPEGRDGDTALWDFMLSNDGSYNRVMLIIFLNPQGPEA